MGTGFELCCENKILAENVKKALKNFSGQSI